MAEPAIFLDRDNTLIDDPGFINHPAQVKLLPGVPKALRRLRDMGFKLIVVSNQSGIARGLLDEEKLSRVHERLHKLLAAHGVSLDGVYFCPYLDGPEAVVEEYRRDSELRKPAPGMLLQAASERDIDLSRSWMVGDRASDVEAGAAAECRTILVNAGRKQYNGSVQPDHTVQSLTEAVRIVEQHRKTSEPPQPSPPTEHSSIKILADIRDAIRRQDRRASQDDFSFMRLVGSLMQMLAIVAALWGTVGVFRDMHLAAVARFGLAIFLQLLAVAVQLAYRRP